MHSPFQIIFIALLFAAGLWTVFNLIEIVSLTLDIQVIRRMRQRERSNQ